MRPPSDGKLRLSAIVRQYRADVVSRMVQVLARVHEDGAIRRGRARQSRSTSPGSSRRRARSAGSPGRRASPPGGLVEGWRGSIRMADPNPSSVAEHSSASGPGNMSSVP